MDTIKATFWEGPTSKKLLSLGVFAGALILLDSLLPGTGVLLALAAFLLVYFQSGINRYLVQFLNWAAKAGAFTAGGATQQ